MEYREMKMQAGTERPSLLGFGCMRFPKTPEGKIDENGAAELIDAAIRTPLIPTTRGTASRLWGGC